MRPSASSPASFSLLGGHGVYPDLGQWSMVSLHKQVEDWSLNPHGVTRNHKESTISVISGRDSSSPSISLARIQYVGAEMS